MNDQSDHPAFVRLRAELDAAWDGLDVLGELEDGGRERVVADLLTSVPDAASRAARETDPEAVVAEVRRRLVPDAPTSDRAPGDRGCATTSCAPPSRQPRQPSRRARPGELRADERRPDARRADGR